jgi:hypothetical protein
MRGGYRSVRLDHQISPQSKRKTYFVRNLLGSSYGVADRVGGEGE